MNSISSNFHISNLIVHVINYIAVPNSRHLDAATLITRRILSLVTEYYQKLKRQEKFTDVTLASEDRQQVGAHRVIFTVSK